MNKKSMSAAVSRSSLFGPPLVLEGEDSAAYDELLGRVYAAVKPVDVIDEILISDAVALEWEVLRWRRLKFSLVRSHAHRALTEFLGEHLEYNLYREQFTEDLTEFLENTLPEDNAKDSARKLARGCARDQADADAVDKVNGILARNCTNIERFFDEAQKQKAEELARAYLRGEDDAITLVHKHLEKASVTIDDLLVKSMQKHGLEYIERLDRLTTITESRRNSSLREIDRRRATLGETVRRTMQKMEDDNLKVIEATPAKRNSAA
jgi:hypothetical protein